MLQELTRGTFPNSTNWMDIPSEYMETAATTRPPLMAPSTPSTASTAATTRSGQSAVSSLTGGTTQQESTRLMNQAPDEGFTTIALRPGGSRAILREHPPPNNDQGREMCVDWWTRGACYSNCGRRGTHRPFASPGERTRLLTYIREHLAAPATDTST
jgi:hypothetical protein